MGCFETNDNTQKNVNYRICGSIKPLVGSCKDKTQNRKHSFSGKRQGSDGVKSSYYAPHEDDDGYDKWSDRVTKEDTFEPDPWK